ncbi:unnamed protein product [Rotaria magnacalcarata]|uniref:Uncharacterized protein n=1 Tax=Rotaria magnacalcarata TaxID=392030 RepID=A0A819CRE0_9BILA|nr:unnamed protein product [Rotaria magnacalcarata]CAF3810734.1 unnamed protein product [Rotaria magnacalcarata]CAF3825268.1 unnamed protein product [Rotaria magnacalcarata]CAF3857310.1 unnamed protein product [Rotaria magnacalcarata]CAF3932049.1 unnamed protein product [Rotaria magnacalcarata]
MLFYQIVQVFLLISTIQSEQNFHVNGPFGKAHLKSGMPSPFNCNRSACDYVDYEFVKSGQDNSTWLMINLRRQLEFRYYSRERNCSGNYKFIAKSPIAERVNYNESTQIHLVFVDRNDQIYVSYATNSNQTIPQCQYGLDSSTLIFQMNETSNTY